MRQLSRSAAVLVSIALFGIDPAVAQFLVGAGTHFGQNRGDVAKSFELMKNAGISTFRDELYWWLVEKERGTFSLPAETARMTGALDAAGAHGLTPVVILDYGNRHYGGGFPLTDEARQAFAAYARFIATTYRGKVRYYEVWNEWNGGMGHKDATTEMRSAESYLKLLQVTYPAVKQADPDAIVIGGAVDGNVRWTERLVELGGMKSMDVLSIHPYMFHAGKEGTPERLVGYLSQLGTRLAAANGGTVPPIYITETGWSTIDSRLGVSPETAADYVARTYLAVRTIPFVKGMWWYELQNSGSDPRDLQHNFGLVDAKLVPKPAYYAMQAVAPLVSTSVAAERLATPAGEWLIRLRHPDQTTVLALWVANSGPKPVELAFSVPADTTATISGGAAGYQAKERRPLRRGQNRLELELSGSPVLIEIPRAVATVEGLRHR